MNQPFAHHRGGRVSRSSDLPFCAVILYQDVAAASKAAGLLNRLARRVNHDLEVDTTFWSFDVLRLGPVAELAMERFAAADLIVVSSNAAELLPKTVARCLEASMGRRQDNPLAVAAMICGPTGDLGEVPLCNQLRAICCRNEGDSFFWARDCAEAENHLTPDTVSARASASSRVLDSIMQRPLPRDPYWRA